MTCKRHELLSCIEDSEEESSIDSITSSEDDKDRKKSWVCIDSDEYSPSESIENLIVKDKIALEEDYNENINSNEDQEKNTIDFIYTNINLLLQKNIDI